MGDAVWEIDEVLTIGNRIESHAGSGQEEGRSCFEPWASFRWPSHDRHKIIDDVFLIE